MNDDNIKKILLVVENTDEAIKAAEAAIKFAKKYNSQIIALNVLNKIVIDYLEKCSNKRRSEIEIEVEENGWRYLYHIEEIAKDEGISVIIFQEEGLHEDIIIKYADKYNVNLIVFGYTKGNLNIRRLADKSIMNTIERGKYSVLIVQ